MFGFGNRQMESYTSKLLNSPEYSVVLLGAGVSAPLGCPLMRGFIDLGRDYLSGGLFSAEEKDDVETVLNLYQTLRTQLSITEEDIENIENILSLVDLSKFIRSNPVKVLQDDLLPDRTRRFIDAVLTKSATVPRPESNVWCETVPNSAVSPYKTFIRALAHHGENITILTLNYDCIIEYICYCMGLPFTYRRDLGPGVEIIKLHGSNNWVQCSNEECPEKHKLSVTEIFFKASSDGADSGYIDRGERTTCVSCKTPLTPYIVPPTWTKDINNPVLRNNWTRAAKVSSLSETFLAVGYSLPGGDSHVRQLLNIGFSSGKLRQAIVLVGKDVESRKRWTSLFRESWRVRLALPESYFETAAGWMILRALNIPSSFGDRYNEFILPVSMGFAATPTIVNTNLKPLHDAALAEGRIKANYLSSNDYFVRVSGHVSNLRRPGHSTPPGVFDAECAKALDWKPSGPILPTHGKSIN